MSVKHLSTLTRVFSVGLMTSALPAAMQSVQFCCPLQRGVSTQLGSLVSRLAGSFTELGHCMQLFSPPLCKP